jgi:hypothetical protein
MLYAREAVEAIRQEITREVEQFLRVVFEDRRKTGSLDLEATEMALRSALHRAGAAAIESTGEFGRRIYAQAWERGWSRALKKVIIGDGAEWIWNLVALHFPGAIQIVDLYHARQHLWELARRLFPNEVGKQKAWMKIHQKRLLDRGKIERLVGALRSIESDNPEVAEKIRSEADYFERNAKRMRCPKFRGQHLFVGSGVIEAGCNAECIVTQSCAAEEPPIPIVSWMMC